MKKTRSLTLIGFSLCVIILLSLFLPMFTVVDNTGAVIENYTSSKLLLNLFNGGLAGNSLGLVVAVGYLMLLFVTVMFFVFALLRTKRVFIYRRWLVSISMVMLILSFVLLIISFVFASKQNVIEGLEIVKQYYVSITPYLNLLLSSVVFASTFVVGTYCVENKNNR